jgi:hypothetical protein
MQHGMLGHACGARQPLFEFRAHLRHSGAGISANFLRVNLPQRRVLLDLRVQKRLCDGRVIDFAVPVPAEADQIDNDVICKFLPASPRSDLPR